MRILQVTSGYAPQIGGVERHVRGISEGLVNLGHDVTVAAMCADLSLPQYEVLGGVKVLRFRGVGRGYYRFPAGLGRYLRAHSSHFDVVHAHNYHALPLITAAIHGNSRVVISPNLHGVAHSSLAGLLHQAYGPFARRALRNVARVICLSNGEAELAMRRLALATRQVVVVPSGIGLAGKPAVTTVLKEPGLLLSVGRLELYKRVDQLIAAATFLPPGYTLAIAGDGPERGRLERSAARAGCGDRIRFLGRVGDEELRRLYERAVVVATVSAAESFGITVLEALAYGCQVICSAIPAFSDFATEFPEAVTLVGLDASAAATAAAVREAALRGPTHVDLGGYAWGSIASRLVTIYHELVSRQGRQQVEVGADTYASH